MACDFNRQLETDSRHCKLFWVVNWYNEKWEKGKHCCYQVCLNINPEGGPTIDSVWCHKGLSLNIWKFKQSSKEELFSSETFNGGEAVDWILN